MEVQTQTQPERNTSYGPLISIVIIVVVLVVGALYLFGEQMTRSHTQQNLPLILGNDATDTSVAR